MRRRRMKKKSFNSMARKILCLALSASMVTGNLAWNVFAADAEDVQDQTSQLQLNCETKALELLDNGRSIAAKVCLTQPDSLIGQNIFTEDITLGGVFRNMVVRDVQNDHDTILLDLVGVPDFSENDVQGTMEFPGFLFDGDDSVTASIDVIEKEGEEVTTKPYFHPYLDGLRENGDNIEMVIVLMPLVGKFTDGFSAKDIAFYQDLYGAKIKNARKTEDGCYEIMVSAPKVEIEGYSYFVRLSR
jgi:hypothetical protein